ncbi:hypothetical protein [Actinomyces oris]|uniref:hypothetical protein n=1 Tax=Actinomyces oris TaxID=544580 RepID=UPI0028D17783|nr:hypothetical protein [Actinomyces oris]
MPPAAESPADADTDTAAASPAHRHRRGWSKRLTSILSALRVGFLLASATAVGLYFLWGIGLSHLFTPLRKQCQYPVLIAVGLWVACAAICTKSFSEWAEQNVGTPKPPKIPLFLLPAGIAGCAGYAVWRVILLWREVLDAGFHVGELLAVALGLAAAGLLATCDAVLRGIRACRPRESVPTKRGRGRHPWVPTLRPVALSRRTVAATGALILLPSVVLTGIAAVPHYRWTTPVRHTTAAPISDSQLPSAPSSLGSQAAWSKDVDGMLDVVGGAAGPVVLTTTGLMGLNPKDGSVRWRYQRDGAVYSVLALGFATRSMDDTYLITSPNHRYIALRLSGPGFIINGGRQHHSSPDDHDVQPHVTLVLDSVTGKVTHERVSAGGAFQLTDSALLDDTTVYSLDKGTELWDFRSARIRGLDLDPGAYIGTAGHASFLIDAGKDRRLSLIPQAHPDQITPAPDFLTNGSGYPVIIDGWVGYFTSDSKLRTQSVIHPGHAYAASLDGLAKVTGADTQTYDLGVTLGVNTIASRASGTLALFPSNPPSKRTKGFPDSDSSWDGVPSVGQVFDPHSKAVKPVHESAGISGIAIGITSRATETNPGGQITARTPDGHSASLPVAPGTTFYSPSTDIFSNAKLNDLAVAHANYSCLSALSTPGATLILLDTAPPWDGRSHYFRIYGITGGK